MRPDWFLTDDAAARLMAESLGLEAHGSLEVELWAASTHLIGKPEAERVLL
jgi:predicted nucleic acid-binding protein